MEAVPPGPPLPEAVWATFLEIERLNHTWAIFDQPFDHSYGRLPGETEIRPWSVPRTTGYFLYTLVRTHRSSRLLEIGTSLAYSSLWLGAAAMGRAVDTIEIHPLKAALARKHIAASSLSNIRLREGEALEITAAWREKLDFAFFDADPENYIRYFDYLRSWFSPGAVLVMDNALNHSVETRPFVEYLAEVQEWQSWIHPVDNGLLIGVRMG